MLGLHRVKMGIVTYIGSDLIMADMLLAHLYGHTKGGLSVIVTVDKDDTTSDLVLELLLGDKEGCGWTSISHRDTETLVVTDGKVSAKLSRRLHFGQGDLVAVQNELWTGIVRCLDKGPVIVYETVSGGVMYQRTTQVWMNGKVKGTVVTDDEIDTEAFGALCDESDGLWFYELRDKEGVRLLAKDRVAHRHGLCRSSGLIKQRDVGEREAFNVRDHSLVVEQGLEATLIDFYLKRGALSVPAWVLEIVTNDDVWCMGTMVAHTDAVLAQLVIGDHRLRKNTTSTSSAFLSSMSTLTAPNQKTRPHLAKIQDMEVPNPAP